MDTGGTAWLMISAALVLFMTPGLALFYGGMVKEKSVVSMMMLSFGALGLVALVGRDPFSHEPNPSSSMGGVYPASCRRTAPFRWEPGSSPSWA